MTARKSPGPEPEEAAPMAPANVAGPGGSPSGQAPGNAGPVPGAPEGTQPAAAAPAPPASPQEQELRQDIERTREQLGQAIEELAGKTDVKARARGKASQFSNRLQGKVAQVKEQAKAAGGGMRGQLAAQAAAARQNAASVPAKDLLHDRAAATGAAARKAIPAPFQRAATAAAQRRAPLAAVLATAAILCYLTVRRRRR